MSGVLSCSSLEAAQEDCTSLQGPTHMQGSCTHSALNVCVNYSGAGRAWGHPVLCVVCEQTGQVCVRLELGSGLGLGLGLRLGEPFCPLTQEKAPQGEDAQAVSWSSTRSFFH